MKPFHRKLLTGLAVACALAAGPVGYYLYSQYTSAHCRKYSGSEGIWNQAAVQACENAGCQVRQGKTVDPLPEYVDDEYTEFTCVNR